MPGETLRNKASDDPEGELAAFAVRPPLRCFEIVDLRTGARCGELAVWSRPTNGARPLGYFCSAHSFPTDEPIQDDAPFRRVGITLDVLFAGVSWDRSKAHAEAVERLEAAVQALGGVINLQTCRSQVGRIGPVPRAGAGNGNGGIPS